MELQQLRYFLEVAQSQHMTRSAEKLHISQPSLSQSIKRLERELGVPLFAARGRSIELTEQGRFLRDRLQPLLQCLDALPDQLQELSDPEQTTISLHVSAASLVVSEAIIEYRRMHPKTSFRFLQSQDAHLFDVGISADRDGRRYPDHEDCFTCTEKIYLAVPATERYKRISAIRLADFRELDFISLDARRQFRQICDHLCAEAGFTPHIIFESDSPETVRNMIAAHMGVGFWPAFSWGKLKPVDMKLLDVSDPPCRRSIILRRQKNRVDSRIVDDFFDFLCDYFMNRMTETYGIQRI